MLFYKRYIVSSNSNSLTLHYFISERVQKKSPRRGIEPRSGTRQAPILTIKLSRMLNVEISCSLEYLVPLFFA